MEETLSSCILYSLQNFLPENALFMAERLWAESNRSETAASLLASVYIHMNKYQKALAVLEGLNIPFYTLNNSSMINVRMVAKIFE